jgi:hypothetical protein
MKKYRSLEHILKKEETNEQFKYNFDKNLNLKKSLSIPDLDLQLVFLTKAEEMTIIDEARTALNCTDGTKDIQKFIDLADKFYARIRNAPIREHFQLVLLSKLEGRAYDVAKNLDTLDWEVLKPALESAFVEKLTLTNLHTQLANCIQNNNESVFTYSMRLKDILNKISKAYKEQDENINFYDTDAPAMAAFEEGLLDPNIRILIKSRANSIEEAIELAILEENRKKSKLAIQNIQQKVCTYCCESGHPLSECLRFKKENNICQNCKIIGHFPSDCPNNKKFLKIKK